MDVDRSWDLIEAELAQRFPAVLDTLRPGVASAELDRLGELVGADLPEPFRRSWMRHDGQDDPTRLIHFVNFRSLSSVATMIEESQTMLELFGDEDPVEFVTPDRLGNRVWERGWVKFGEFEGDGWVLDLAPGPNGVPGQVFDRAHDNISTDTVADSFEQFLGEIATRLRDGTYDDDDGIEILSLR